jgi:Gpi18-like mannosyltransferase
MRLRELLLLGVIVRVALAPFLAHPFDVYSWYVVGENALTGREPLSSFLAPYSYALFIFVFPATLAFTIISAYAGSYTVPMSSLNAVLNPGSPWNITVVPGPLFDLLVKLPLILSDLVIAVLIYKLVKRHLNEEKLAVSASALWFLNPLTIWISSGWGMFDTLPALFTVLCFSLVLDKRFALAGISLALAIAMKYYAVVLVFPLLLLAWQKGRWKSLERSLGSAVVATTALSAPLLTQTTSGFGALITTSAPNVLYYSGLSFWTAMTLFTTRFNVNLISDVLIAALLMITYVWTCKGRSASDLVSGSVYFGLPILVLLATYRFIGENYFVWILPFASILASRASRTRTLYWVLSIVALVSSITNSLLPYYMLPMATWIGGYLASFLFVVAPYRVGPQGSVTQALSVGKVFLSALGICTTALLILTSREWIKDFRANRGHRREYPTGTRKGMSLRLIRVIARTRQRKPGRTSRG